MKSVKFPNTRPLLIIEYRIITVRSVKITQYRIAIQTSPGPFPNHPLTLVHFLFLPKPIDLHHRHTVPPTIAVTPN